LTRQSISKKNRRKRMQASLPRFFSGFFFCVLRTPAELRSADCRWVILRVCLHTLPRRRCHTTTPAGRWRSHRARVAGRKRDPETVGKLAFPSDFRIPFSSACRNIHGHKTQAFGVSSRGGFGLPKPPSRLFPFIQVQTHRYTADNTAPSRRSAARACHAQ